MFLSVVISCFAQDQQNDALLQADSLFQQKKYTQSFEIYQHLLEKENLASPAMLLKMAFIKEGLGDYTNALYYLNLYHLKAADKKTLGKMEELAQKNDLQGYNLSDFDIIKAVFFKYFNIILLSLAALAIMITALMLYTRRKMNKSPVAAGILAVFFLALLFYTLNFSRTYNRGIITDRSTYLMDGPSAGAEVISILGKGHRIPIYGQIDVWTKTEWEGNTAYVKTGKVKPVSFL